MKTNRIECRVCCGSDPDESGTLPRTDYLTAGNASRPPPHLICSELPGRTPAHTHISHPSLLFRLTLSLWYFRQWFAGAGFYLSVGRRLMVV
jgi:hypothetical protein